MRDSTALLAHRQAAADACDLPDTYDWLLLEVEPRVREAGPGCDIFSIEVAPGSTRQSLCLPVKDEVAGRVVYFHEPITCAGETSIEVEVERVGEPAAWEVHW